MFRDNLHAEKPSTFFMPKILHSSEIHMYFTANTSYDYLLNKARRTFDEEVLRCFRLSSFPVVTISRM